MLLDERILEEDHHCCWDDRYELKIVATKIYEVAAEMMVVTKEN